MKGGEVLQCDVRFNLWVFLITLNPNQDLLLCKKLKIMHSGTYFPSSKAPGLDLTCWLLNPSKSLQSFSLAILDRVSSLQWRRQFSEWLQALETQPFYSSPNPRAAEIWLSIDSEISAPILGHPKFGCQLTAKFQLSRFLDSQISVVKKFITAIISINYNPSINNYNWLTLFYMYLYLNPYLNTFNAIT